MKKLLCIISNNPFEGSKVIEQLEAAMVAAVFDFDVSVLFTGNGMNCLREYQNGDLIGARSPGKLISGLDMYEINNLFACAEAVSSQKIPKNVQIIDLQEQRTLIEAQDFVLGGAA
ncbi:MAG: hypothetical protein GKR90_04840 [Pseudomonadales bacterium]|nr:hypothetical protein [Pseudomonadales bacterium]